MDTEDNSKELLLSGRSGFEKELTHIAARDHRGDAYYSQGDVRGFLAWCAKRAPCDIWAHNAGYDLGGFFGDSLDDLDLTLVRKKLIRARWDGCCFMDSHNIYPMALDELAIHFGLEKLPFRNDREYCERDVAIGWEAMRHAYRFIEENDLGEMSATMGGIATRLFAAGGGGAWFDGFYLSREAYHGGRSELFRATCTEPMIYADVNSLHPWALTQGMPGPVALSRDLDSPWGFASIEIDVPECDLGVLPVRGALGGVSYPWGRFCGVWTLPEIQAAERRGARIRKVFECYTSPEGVPYYANFILHFYDERLKTKNPAKKIFFKQLLNSFGGNLGMSGKIERSVNLSDNIETPGYAYGRKKLVEIQIELPQRVNYLHAAYMTALSRLRMLDFMEAIGLDKICMLAVDGLIFKKSGNCPVFSDKLGEFKLVAERDSFLAWDDGAFGFGEFYKAKGVKRQMAEDFIKRGMTKFHIPYGIREGCVFFDEGNSRKAGVWRTVARHARTIYNKKGMRKGRYYPRRVEQRKYHSRMALTDGGFYDDTLRHGE